MGPSGRDEDLTTDEWIWRRNRRLAGEPATDRTKGRFVRLRDDMPMPAWQAGRDRQVALGRGAPGAEPVRYQAVAATRSSAPPVAGEVPTVRDARKPVRLRRMPDGTLEPVPGHMTGPFAFGEWAHNIDWPGFVDDAITIGTGVAGGAKAAAKDALDWISLGGGLYGMGRAAWDDMTDPKPPPHHKR